MVRRGKSEKLSVTIRSELAREIRSLVPKGEVSSFIAEAVQQYLASRHQRLALEKAFGAWKNELHEELTRPENSVSYVRSLREAGKERLQASNEDNGR